jgi:hypothetical protein
MTSTPANRSIVAGPNASPLVVSELCCTRSTVAAHGRVAPRRVIGQVHHVDGWAAAKGETNIKKLTLACGPDNRLIEEGGWTTRKRKDGRTEWIPPPHLDTGQTRVNDYHHPEEFLLPEDEDP